MKKSREIGTVKVTVQTEKRLEAITILSYAIRDVAKALATGTKVEIKNNTFSGVEVGVSVDTDEKVAQTLIEREEP